MGVSTGNCKLVTIDKRNQNNGFDGNIWINLDSEALLKQNCHTQNMKRTNLCRQIQLVLILFQSHCT
jgi:hypothetical protein